MTKYFVDSEFDDDGQTIDLISIGIVADDGREYYAQSCEFNVNGANAWVWQNVFPHLRVCPYTAKPLTNLYVDIQDHSRIGKCTPQFHLGGLSDYVTKQIESGRYQECPWRTREQIRDEVKAFCDPEKYGRPEFMGWCCSYDHVVLCQLFGTMMDIPAGWPHYIRDLQHILDDRSIVDEELPQQENGVHNALADARHIKRLWEYVEDCSNNVLVGFRRDGTSYEMGDMPID